MNTQVKVPPRGLAVLLLLGPSLVWCAEYIGSGEIILATRLGAILGVSVLWVPAVSILLKYWIGLCGARYTVITGEGMIDMFDRIPGPRHWAVWLVLAVHLVAGTFSIGSLASAAAAFGRALIPLPLFVWGWIITLFAVTVVWSGRFGVLKAIMSILVFIIIFGVVYVAVFTFPGFKQLLVGFFGFRLPDLPLWATGGRAGLTPWREVLPLLGWAAGGFASQVWYSYWVLGAGYGMAAGGSYGKPADVQQLKGMDDRTANRVKGWLKVVYADATMALIIGLVVTCSFLIAGAGILNPEKIAPEGQAVAFTLSRIFSKLWGPTGAFLFVLSGFAALLSTQIGQLAGWPRLLADAFRICLGRYVGRFSWETQFRTFLVLFVFTNSVIVFSLGFQPVHLIKFAALVDGLVLTPFQALVLAWVHLAILPRMLSPGASRILKPHPVIAGGLIIATVFFGYVCIFQVPRELVRLFSG